jgi:quercetin dioxygenase-like cupin family protein
VAKEHGIEGRTFRLRRLMIEPGGTVPWHSHADRPAIIYIVSGTIEEYSSDCAVPIVHKAGDVSPETKGVSHWWKNTGDETVVLLSADLPTDPSDKDM